MDKAVYVVLEEDGTEVDEEEYFQTLPDNTLLMLLHVGDKWLPYGPPFTWVNVNVNGTKDYESKEKKRFWTSHESEVVKFFSENFSNENSY